MFSTDEINEPSCLLAPTLLAAGLRGWEDRTELFVFVYSSIDEHDTKNTCEAVQ